MKLRSLKRLLLATTAGCLAGSAAIVSVGVTLPLTVAAPDPVASLAQMSSSDEVVSTLPELELVLPNFQKKLQRPIVDPPPPKPKPIQKPKPKPEKIVRTPPAGFKVLGTIIEEGRNFAMLQVTPNKFEVAGVGDRLEGLVNAEIVRVETDLIQLRYQGKVFELAVPKRKRLPGEEEELK